MKPLVIFGAGELAEVAYFYFTHDTQREVVAFTVDEAYVKGESFLGLPFLPFERIDERHPAERFDLFVAVSYAKLNAVRAQKVAEARQKGYSLATYVSSKATVWPGLEVGENCFILEDNTIQPFARIGANVTLWSGNHIGHHSIIQDNCFVTSHVVISGGVTVGEGSFIGVNATLRDHVTIGRQCVIGAGSLILQDAADFSVYTTPAAELSKVPSTRLRKI
jgi:sugar O-acyltransferase (sialic acid O-acetyltransferase NeuD family)